jgi:hypothetical protein
METVVKKNITAGSIYIFSGWISRGILISEEWTARISSFYSKKQYTNPFVYSSGTFPQFYLVYDR